MFLPGANVAKCRLYPYEYNGTQKQALIIVNGWKTGGNIKLGFSFAHIHILFLYIHEITKNIYVKYVSTSCYCVHIFMTGFVKKEK